MNKIVKIFEKFVNKTLINTNKLFFRFKNKKNRTIEISNVNKIIIFVITLLFFYLFYLSIPNLYKKTWVQNTLEDKLAKEFKINFSISSEIIYNILPSPHFLIKNSRIFRDASDDAKSISEIKKLRIFISQKNFFKKEDIYIKNLIIDDANFLLNGKDFNLLNKLSTKNISDKKIKVINSNIFFKNKYDEAFAIVKISKAFLIYSNLKLLNIFDLKGEVFNLPFSFTLNDQILFSGSREIKILSKKIKFNFLDKSIRKTKDFITGINVTSIHNSKIYTNYNIDKNIILLNSKNSKNSKIKNSKMDYSGKLSLKPFDLNMDINLEKLEFSKIFNSNSVFFELLKTKLFFNENISSRVSLNITSLQRNKLFDSAKINFNLINGDINFNKSKFTNDKIGSIEIRDSLLFNDKEKLILNCDIVININNSENLFSFFQTPKVSRKFGKKIYFNLDYDFLSEEIIFNNFRVDDNVSSDKLVNIINNFFRNKDNNLNTRRRTINKIFSFYEG